MGRALARARSGRPARLLHAFESRLPLLAAALLATGLLVWASLEDGLPYAARAIAEALPREVDAPLGRGALQGLDGLVFEPSGLAAGGPGAAARGARRADRGGRVGSRRAAGVSLQPGPRSERAGNALGIVVMTDQLVALAASEQEILAVLAHELGHIEHRHAVRGELQNSLAPVLLATVTGDLASTGALSAALPTFLLQMKHSRAFEREADDYARAALERMGVAPAHRAAILTRLAGMRGNSDAGRGRYLSSQPGLGERVERRQGRGR